MLYRSNAQSRVLEHALFNAGIAYRVYGGLRFFERAEIKHALAYLRLLENPNDDTAFLRVVNFPPRGIGARTLESLQDAARAADTSLVRAVPQIAGKGGVSLAAFVKLLDLLRARTAELPLPDLVTAVLDGSGLAAHYKAERDGQERVENLNELVNAAIGFLGEQDYTLDTPAATRVAEAGAAAPPAAANTSGEGGAVPDLAAASAAQLSPLAAFLAHASLEAGDNQASQGQDALQLMTIHSAKGLEFDAVFITGLEEGLFPHDNSTSEPDGMEEERRLMYVAITRARRRLYLSFAQNRLLHGQTRYGIRSRFFDELPAASLKWLTPRLRQGFALRTGAWQDARASNDSALLRANANGGHGSQYRIGQSVHHAKFGDGVIITLEGSGDDARARINFGPQGVKELALAVAKLQAA